MDQRGRGSLSQPDRHQEKTCAHCGRKFERRRMRDIDWQEMRYCSAACRRETKRRVHSDLEVAIRSLLARRSPTATICPSEAARALFGDEFRAYMEDTRRAARRMALREELVITQKNRRVDPSSFRGPIRIGRGRSFTGPGQARHNVDAISATHGT